MDWKYLAGSLLLGVQLFAAQPTTTNYTLEDYGFGNGGGTTGTGTYSIEGIAGEVSGPDTGTANYGLGSGLLEAQQANVPTLTLSNAGNFTNKLLVVIGTQNNPTDAKYMIAISSDSFATTYYVQSDGTIGATLGFEDYQTYAAWGGVSGSFITGLTDSTTYAAKSRALKGNFTETGYGPTSSAATAALTLTFDIDISASDSETAPPYQVGFGDLLPSTVTDGPSKVWLDIETTASSGASVFILSANTGLASTAAGYTIASVTGDLSSLNEGFGARGDTVAQASGGPLAFQNPYNGAGNNIGIIDNSYRRLVAAAAAIGSGRSSMILKAKATSTTPAATDYADLYTLVATASF